MASDALIEQLKSGVGNAIEAVTIFDSLEPVDIDFMIGRWKGAGCPSSHPMDGLLETFNWHGKRFLSQESVHPLVMQRSSGGFANANPVYLMPFLKFLGRGQIPRWPWLSRTVGLLLPLLSSRKARARLRMTEFRGKSSATMVYDHLPIHDVFRKIDDNSVMGAMDMKDMESPFFFVLMRE